MSERDREAERQRTREWLAALDDVLARDGAEAAERLLRQLQRRAARHGVTLPFTVNTPPVNTIARDEEPRFPGDPEMEERIEAMVRWNAMAMVARANRRQKGIGGHIGSFASAGTLFEVGFSHFFRGARHPEGADQLYLQGHASPGVYARAFLEGRLSEAQLDNFRRELTPGGGLSSYPHPWLMPGFWTFPSVSMGLSPLMAIYQARFNRYLENRGLAEKTGRVWAILGDGEMDEPESLGALRVASREHLSNLVFVVDCNLQRLDGPVLGGGRLIDELERAYLGAGWRVIKVLWGGEWDRLLEKDRDGLLVERMGEVLDGELQKYVVEGGGYVREKFFGTSPALETLVDDLSDAELGRLRRGGHDVRKVFAAFHAAEQEPELPTVILAQTVKGWGLGPAGEGLNVAHKTKDLDTAQLRGFRDRFDVPVSDDRLEDVPYVKPADDAPEMRYLRERREALGGAVPKRTVRAEPLPKPDPALFERFHEGSKGRDLTTTAALVRLLSDLLKDEALGKLLVPIVPDEARTFGVEALFPRVGIYSAHGQPYEPVDADQLLAYRERKDGQILEEGITEGGALSSTIAAGTAYATHGVNTIPFYFFYSMFGFQRVGDLIWAAGDARARGFLVGCTSGRTTLNGEGLQHQDGHSHLMGHAYPAIRAYDTTYGYEVAVLVEEGIRRMYVDGEDVMYYLTVANEPYPHPAMPEGAREGILRGMYRLRAAEKGGEVRRATILAAGPLVHAALSAQSSLEEDYGVTTDVWAVTSWQQLYRDAAECERAARLHPEREAPVPYLQRCLGDHPGVVVAVSDFVKALPHTLGKWLPDDFVALGTDGFGRSDSRERLRDFFEVDDRHVVQATLSALARAGRYPHGPAEQAVADLGIDPDKPDPMKV